MSNTQLAVKQSFTEMQQMSNVFYTSGLFSDLKNEAQALVKIMVGAEYFMQPFESLQNVQIIQGKATLSANAMATAIKASAKYDYEIRQMDDSAVSLEFFQGTKSLGFSDFTIEDARKAGTQNIQKFPRNMLFARAISNGLRWYAPDVFKSAVYTPEEMGAAVDDDGSMISEPRREQRPIEAEEAEGEPRPSQDEIDKAYTRYVTLKITKDRGNLSSQSNEEFKTLVDSLKEFRAHGESPSDAAKEAGDRATKEAAAQDAAKEAEKPKTPYTKKREEAIATTPEQDREIEEIFGGEPEGEVVEGEVEEAEVAEPRDPNLHTDAQRRALFAIATEKWGAGDHVKARLEKMADKSISQLMKGEMADLISEIQELPASVLLKITPKQKRQVKELATELYGDDADDEILRLHEGTVIEDWSFAQGDDAIARLEKLKSA